MARPMDTKSKNERDLSTIVTFSSGLGFGGVLAISQALRVGKSAISFDLSIWTAIAFLVGSTSLFAYLRLVFTCGNRTPRFFRYGGFVVLALMTSLALLYPLPLRPLDPPPQRVAGVAAALCFFSPRFTPVYPVDPAAEIAATRPGAVQKDFTKG